MKLLFALFVVPVQLFAQDITGVWTGTLYSDTTLFIKYELAISEYNGKLSGYSHTIFVIDSVQNVGIKSIKIKKVGKEFFLEDDKLVFNNYTGPAAKGVKQYSKLFLSENDTALVLAGPWKTNQTKEYQGITGKVFLQRKKKIKESLIMAKLDNLGLASSLSFMTSTHQPQDLAILYHSGFNATSPKPADVASENFPNTVAPHNPGIQQHSQPGKEGKQSSEQAVNTENIAKQNAEVESVQLPAPDRAIEKDNSLDMPPARGLATKPGANLIAGQQKTQKSGTGMRREDSVVSTGLIKGPPAPMAKTATIKNKSLNGVSIRSGTPRINPQPEGDIKMPDKILKKENRVVKGINKADTSVIAKVPPTKIERIPGVSILSGISTPSETNNKVRGEIVNKDNAVNKDHQAGPSFTNGKSTPKVEPAHIVSIKQAPQINTQQEEIKEIPGPALLKNSQNIKPVVVSKAAAEIATRKIEAIRSVDIKSDSLLLTLYDNGEIDGDTVSVLLNGKVIMPMQGLTAKAINKTIYLTPEMGDSVVLIMYAENLGSIAPNTGLLVIHDEGDIYEIRFTGDLKKNSSIILKRKRKN